MTQDNPAPSHRIAALLRASRPRWRFCVRMTASGLAAFAVGQALHIPLNGLWMILTAIVVISDERRRIGARDTRIHHRHGRRRDLWRGPRYTRSAQHAVGGGFRHGARDRAAGIVAAFNPNFRVAPFSAVLVILIAGQFGEGPIASAITRSGEVALGGIIAVVVSLLVFPQRANHMRLSAAARYWSGSRATYRNS